MTGEKIDPTGAHGMRPDAGQRTALPEPDISEHRGPLDEDRDDGGLLYNGTRVEITVLHGGWHAVGRIVDHGSVPAAYLSIERDTGRRVVVFTGPGVIVEPALPEHPGA